MSHNPSIYNISLQSTDYKLRVCSKFFVIVAGIYLMRIIMNQEPLGVASDIVRPVDLPRWSEIAPAHYLTDYSAIGEGPKHSTSPFPFDSELNHKIILW